MNNSPKEYACPMKESEDESGADLYRDEIGEL
jgi:hypothetical protein